MKLSKKLSLRFYRFRHQNWSAPSLVSFFLVACMIIIYSFETLGLLHKEKNLEYRLKSTEFSKIIFLTFFLVLSKENPSLIQTDIENILKHKEESREVILEKFKNQKMLKIEKIYEMLEEGAELQERFESSLVAENTTETVNEKDDELRGLYSL